jgi:hypothetical protein
MVEEKMSEVTAFVVTNRGNLVSHYYGLTVFIEEWIGDWGKDIDTGVYFHREELEVL